MVDVFLEFCLKSIVEKFSSFGEEELFHIIEGLSVVSVSGNEVAFVEQGIETGVEEVANVGGFGLHKIRPCKSVYPPILTTPTKLGHTLVFGRFCCEFLSNFWAIPQWFPIPHS